MPPLLELHVSSHTPGGGEGGEGGEGGGGEGGGEGGGGGGEGGKGGNAEAALNQQAKEIATKAPASASPLP